MDQAEQAWGMTLARWNEAVEECRLTPAGIERAYGFCASQVRKWLDGDTIPRDKSKTKMEGVIEMLKKTKRIPYSPVWGYALPEQIERLKQSIPQQERDRILEQIKKQTKLGGKVD